MTATPRSPQTPTLANVSSSASSVTLFEANTAAVARFLYNDSSAVLYLKYGTTAASTTSYTVQVAAGGFYEFPGSPCYNGKVTGIWASANGAARTTEVTG